MKCRRETLVAFVGALLLASTVAARQAPPVTKFVTPIKGQAQIEFTAPQAKVEGNMMVTRIKVKNVSKGPIALLQVDEYWYNLKNETVSGSQPFRVMKPMMPGDIIEVLLKSPRTADMARVNRVFKHANGTVKPTLVPGFKKDS
jgi:flagellar basal body L-ring protein FlgH